MLENLSVLEPALQVADPCSLQEVEALLARAGRERGFESYIYVCGQVYTQANKGLDKFTKTPTVLTNFPLEWVTVYHARNYGTIDPIVATTLQSRLPKVWDLEWLPTERKTAVGTFTRTALDFDVARGFSLPVFGPDGDYGFFSFVSRTGEKEFHDLVKRHSEALFMLAHHVHQLIRQVESDADGEKPAVGLTDREREVLQWTAAGKTSVEIGVILTLSEKTVQYHLYNAMRKLDVYSKPQAVAKALVGGLIHLK